MRVIKVWEKNERGWRGGGGRGSRFGCTVLHFDVHLLLLLYFVVMFTFVNCSSHAVSESGYPVSEGLLRHDYRRLVLTCFVWWGKEAENIPKMT
jgi:hypothetical protein